MPGRGESEVTRTDASEEDQKYIRFVLDVKDAFVAKRFLFEREWYRNILFYIGQQWITYEETFRRWRTRNLPRWVPLPVTNRLASTANVIRSSVAQIVPAFTATPTEENERSILSAAAADKYLGVIMQESGFRGARRRLASWVTLTGNGFLHTEFDTSADTGTVMIPGERCQDCNAEIKPAEINESLSCPTCGSTNLVEDVTLGTRVPQGRIRVSALSPFEVYVNNQIQEIEDQPMILTIDTKNIHIVKQTYGPAADGVTGDTSYETGQQYLHTLANMTQTGYGTGFPSGRTVDDPTESVTLFKVYCKTHADYPDGVYLVMTGDQHILEKVTPYPFKFKNTQKSFYPIVHVRYDDVPGRFWAKTPIDDLVAKQRQRNELESLYQVIIMRCANPVWTMPTGVQSTPITGDPGIVIRYSGQGGAKPERLPGMDAPVSVIKFIEQIDQDFEEIANTFAVMKGKNPGSVRAASAIQMLLERGFGRYGSVFDNLEDAYEHWAIQALELWKQKAIFPRVQAVAKAAGSWQFMEFLGSDIGEVDIRVEAGSTRPRSQASRQMLVGQALQWNLLNSNDPEQKMKIFEEMGMTHLLPGAEADTKVTAEENARFMTWAQQAVQALDDGETDPAVALPHLVATFPVKGSPIIDHHPTHVVHHRRLCLTDAFRSLPDIFQQMMIQHIVQDHLVFMFQEATMGNMGTTSLMAGLLPQEPTQGAQRSGNPEPGKKVGSGKGPGGGGAAQNSGGIAQSMGPQGPQ
jgi:hypothetical protein